MVADKRIVFFSDLCNQDTWNTLVHYNPEECLSLFGLFTDGTFEDNSLCECLIAAHVIII